MIPEREREALMRLTMCAREECGMCKYKETCDFDFQYETATRCMNILADALNADRKTENSSEKPNNSTISKMEQVEDEPQLTPNYCGTCKHREVPCGDLPCDACHSYSNYEPKDEPQTDCAWR